MILFSSHPLAFFKINVSISLPLLTHSWSPHWPAPTNCNMSTYENNLLERKNDQENIWIINIIISLAVLCLSGVLPIKLKATPCFYLYYCTYPAMGLQNWGFICSFFGYYYPLFTSCTAPFLPDNSGPFSSVSHPRVFKLIIHLHDYPYSHGLNFALSYFLAWGKMGFWNWLVYQRKPVLKLSTNLSFLNFLSWLLYFLPMPS